MTDRSAATPRRTSQGCAERVASAPTRPFQSVADYTSAKQAGDSTTASQIVRDAIDRFTDGTISPDEYNALIEATMTAQAGGAS